KRIDQIKRKIFFENLASVQMNLAKGENEELSFFLKEPLKNEKIEYTYYVNNRLRFLQMLKCYFSKHYMQNFGVLEDLKISFLNMKGFEIDIEKMKVLLKTGQGSIFQ